MFTTLLITLLVLEKFKLTSNTLPCNAFIYVPVTMLFLYIGLKNEL